eukprot:8363448-Pyramimonas_sp.AAC.1
MAHSSTLRRGRRKNAGHHSRSQESAHPPVLRYQMNAGHHSRSRATSLPRAPRTSAGALPPLASG